MEQQQVSRAAGVRVGVRAAEHTRGRDSPVGRRDCDVALEGRVCRVTEARDRS